MKKNSIIGLVAASSSALCLLLALPAYAQSQELNSQIKSASSTSSAQYRFSSNDVLPPSGFVEKQSNLYHKKKLTHQSSSNETAHVPTSHKKTVKKVSEHKTFHHDHKSKLSREMAASSLPEPQYTVQAMNLPNIENAAAAVEGADSSFNYTKVAVAATPNQKQSTQTAFNLSSNPSSQSNNQPQRFSLGKKLGMGPGSRFKLNGFISTGAVNTNSKNGALYIIPNHGAIGNDLNFSSTSLIGLQLSARITRTLSAVGQFVADGDDTNGNKMYRVNAEWAFLRFQLDHNGSEVRAGRMRLPLFLYSETEQVGYTYPWIFLPNEVYRIIPFENFNGVDIIYRLPLGSNGWSVDFQPYYGAETSQFDLYTRGAVPVAPGVGVPIPPGKTATFDENNIGGAVVSVGNADMIFRATYVRTTLTGFVPDFVVPTVGEVNLPLFTNQKSDFYSAGGRINWHNLLVIGEFAHRDVPSQIASLTGYYVMLGYQLGQFLPNVTYANIKTTNASQLNNQPVSEFVQNQESYTLGLAYYINSNIVAKSSISFIKPRGVGLFTVNPGRRDVYLYGFSLDAIF